MIAFIINLLTYLDQQPTNLCPDQYKENGWRGRPRSYTATSIKRLIASACQNILKISLNTAQILLVEGISVI